MTSHDEVRARLGTFFAGKHGRPVEIVDYEPITGGYSRMMARFAVVDGVDRRGYVLRSDPPPEQVVVDTSRAVEWEVVRAVHASGAVSVPEPLWLDATGEQFGSPGIIYELIEGRNLLGVLTADGADQLAHADQIADLAASITRVDVAQLPAVLERPADWSSYIDSAVEVWRKQEAAHVEPDPLMRLVADWLDVNRPPPAPLSLVHGDFQVPNIIIRPGVDAVLVDWELSRIGDPREDLGWWALAESSLPTDVMAPNVERICARYREMTGLDETVVNPGTLAYFTVFSSGQVFYQVLRGIGALAMGATTSQRVAYLTVSGNFMHGVMLDGMRRAEEWM
jgi:aminoglycoside phosphotransferase (APT) family kinase protein